VRSVARRRVLQGLGGLLALAGGAPALSQEAAAGRVGDAAMRLSRSTTWKQVSAIRIGFDAHHAQGMVRVGEDFFVTSVEVLERPRPYPEPRGGFDRDQGLGQGWLFRMSPRGELISQTKLGEGAIYHPGGLDFDGRHLWIPVAEYRPGGPSIVYRVDPKTLTPVEVLRFGDHIGAVTRNLRGGTLVGLNWGGRQVYAWRADAAGRIRDPRAAPRPNRSHYIDYQDCHYAGAGRMLCTGLAEYRPSPDRPGVALGGVDLVDLADVRPLWQAPVLAWTAAGRPMTSNPAWFEATPDGLRGYFLPEDGRSTLYVYEAVAGGHP
jgi:hypothetical protein